MKNGRSESSHEATWRGIAFQVRYKAGHYVSDSVTIDWIEIRTENRVPLPVTDTGYLSHFMPATHLESYDGPIAYVMAWLDHEEQATGWRAEDLENRQLPLL